MENTIIWVESEEEAAAIGAEPVKIRGNGEIPWLNYDSSPAGFMVKIFWGRNDNRRGGLATVCMKTRDMTPEEVDAVPMRFSDGYSMGITYGEWKKSPRQQSL